jgi:hypothetical protein
MIKELSKEIAYSQLQKFFREKPFVLFGTGMSCAVDRRFGVESLGNELKNQLSKNCLSDEQKGEWQSVCQSLEKGNNFETSMNNVKNTSLIKKIVKVTGDFVSSTDRQYSAELLSGKIIWPASVLFFKKNLVITDLGASGL